MTTASLTWRPSSRAVDLAASTARRTWDDSMAFLARYQPFDPANGFRISRAATIDREGYRAASTCQNRRDLAAAKRRRAACAGSAAVVWVTGTPHGAGRN